MAPRIRLSLAKPLPTISEAFEDILEDITSNTMGFGNVYMHPESCSGEDYCQSVFQLARSTFPGSLERKHQVQDKDRFGMLQNSQSILNFSESPKVISRYAVPNLISLEKNTFILDCIKSHSTSTSTSGMDTLEELFTEAQATCEWKCPLGSEHMGTDCSQSNFHRSRLVEPQEKIVRKHYMVGLPRHPSPRPAPRENSCQEQKYLKNQGKVPFLESKSNKNPLLVNGKSILLQPSKEDPKIWYSSQKGQNSLKPALCPEREQLKPSALKHHLKGEETHTESWVEYFHIDQKATSSDWIAAYQSAWKEAKGRACLLPVIAES